MSENDILQQLQGVDAKDLFEFLSKKAESDLGFAAVAAAHGFKKPSSEKPTALDNLLHTLEVEAVKAIAELDKEQKEAIATDVRCFSFEISLSARKVETEDPETGDVIEQVDIHKFNSKVSEHQGKPGDGQVLFHTETGVMYPSRIAYLQDEVGEHAASKHLFRQTEELARAWVDSKGLPTAYWKQGAEEQRGDPVSEDMRQKVAEANGMDYVPAEQVAEAEQEDAS